jgi:hypothetical protein
MPSILLGDSLLTFPAPSARSRLPGTCRWQLWLLEDGSYLSLVTELEGNLGPSVTNAAEAIADSVYRQVKNTRRDPTRPVSLRFFETYPEHGRVDEVIFAKVEYVYDRRHPRDPIYPQHLMPGWRALEPGAFRALVGWAIAV